MKMSQLRWQRNFALFQKPHGDANIFRSVCWRIGASRHLGFVKLPYLKNDERLT